MDQYRRKGRGVCLWGRGVWADTPQSDTTGYGKRAGGMHSTGMHSCLVYVLATEMFAYNVQSGCSVINLS